MSLRRSRKRRAAAKAAKATALYRAAKPVAGAVRSFARARADRGLRARPKHRRPLAVAAGAIGIAGLAAAVAKRRRREDLGYGPPNESHPSHETLAPAQAAAS